MATKKKTPKDAESKANELAEDSAPDVKEDAAAEAQAEDMSDETTKTDANSDEKTESVDTPDPDPAAEEPEPEILAADNAADVGNDAKDDEALETSNDTKTTEIVAPPAETVVVQKGGFVPTAFGGLVAGAIGFGLAMLTQPDPGPTAADMSALERKVDGQADATIDLSDRIGALEAGGDTSGIEAAQSDTLSAIGALADRLTTLETRLDDIERQPAGDGVSGAALAAYERELKELQSAVDAMSENAALLERDAQSAAKATLQRAAFTRILTALDAGNEFQAPLADLAGLGVEVPGALQAAAAGVPSLSDLQESFPEAARAALDVTGNTGGGGFASFLKTQLGARSLEPREGNDPDAILSRAEAAAGEGRLTDALAEIETLPEEARAELADWSARARHRLEAVAAAQELGDKLN